MQQKFIVKSVSAGKEDHLACRAAAGHRSLRPAISGHSAPGQLDVLRWAPLGLCGARMSKSIQSTGPGKGYNHAVMGPHSTKDRSSCKLAPWCQVLDNMHAHAGDSSPPLQAQVPDGRAGAKTPAIALKKHVSFTGITVELFEDMEEVQTPITAFSRSHTRLPSITMCPGVLYSGPKKNIMGETMLLQDVRHQDVRCRRPQFRSQMLQLSARSWSAARPTWHRLGMQAHSLALELPCLLSQQRLSLLRHQSKTMRMRSLTGGISLERPLLDSPH